MDFLFELVFELLFDVGDYASTSKKVPKTVRYILGTIITIVYVAIVAFLFILGIVIVAGGSLGGIVLIALGVIFLAFSVKRIIQIVKVNRR